MVGDDRTWAVLTHLGGIFVGFFAPLVTLLARGNQSPQLRAHAVEALNFQITWSIVAAGAAVVAVCSFGVLFALPVLVWVFVLICSVLGAVRAGDGALSRYPLTWRVVK